MARRRDAGMKRCGDTASPNHPLSMSLSRLLPASPCLRVFPSQSGSASFVHLCARWLMRVVVIPFSSARGDRIAVFTERWYAWLGHGARPVIGGVMIV